jgi:hypothetical protein
MPGEGTMHPTRLLRRVIHYVWECFREDGEMTLQLTNYKGDELHVEESAEELRVTVRHLVVLSTGEQVQQMEVICFILRYGEWIPLTLSKDGAITVFGTSDPETGRVTITDRKGQAAAAGRCDAWALRLLEEGFLASAARLNPLTIEPMHHLHWPEPTTDTPDLETIEEWMWEDAGCEATDGCWVEIDGRCPHGHPSWLRRLGLV